MGYQLTAENYYSAESNQRYMSVSQYKDFVGTFGMVGCEATAMAKLHGLWSEEPNTAMLVGSYVDSYFEGSLDFFRYEHPEIFKKDGNLKSEYVKAEEIIARAERDELFMKYMSGQKQVIMTGEIAGAEWKIKIDSYIPDLAIVDLKVMKSLTESKFVHDVGIMNFVQYWGYDIQGAVYQEIVYQNTGNKLPFFIAGISKGKKPNLEVIYVADVYLKEALDSVKMHMPHILAVKEGKQEAERCECESCDYCMETKVLSHPIGIVDLVQQV